MPILACMSSHNDQVNIDKRRNYVNGLNVCSVSWGRNRQTVCVCVILINVKIIVAYC